MSMIRVEFLLINYQCTISYTLTSVNTARPPSNIQIPFSHKRLATSPAGVRASKTRSKGSPSNLGIGTRFAMSVWEDDDSNVYDLLVLSLIAYTITDYHKACDIDTSIPQHKNLDLVYSANEHVTGDDFFCGPHEVAFPKPRIPSRSPSTRTKSSEIQSLIQVRTSSSSNVSKVEHGLLEARKDGMRTIEQRPQACHPSSSSGNITTKPILSIGEDFNFVTDTSIRQQQSENALVR